VHDGTCAPHSRPPMLAALHTRPLCWMLTHDVVYSAGRPGAGLTCFVHHHTSVEPCHRPHVAIVHACMLVPRLCSFRHCARSSLCSFVIVLVCHATRSGEARSPSRCLALSPALAHSPHILVLELLADSRIPPLGAGTASAMEPAQSWHAEAVPPALVSYRAMPAPCGQVRASP